MKSKFRRKPIVGIDNLFFKVGDKYLVRESFLCENSNFVKGELLKCIHNFYAWHDDIYVISFEKENAEKRKVIIYDWCYDENNKTHIKTTTEIKNELQTYEHFFERVD